MAKCVCGVCTAVFTCEHCVHVELSFLFEPPPSRQQFFRTSGVMAAILSGFLGPAYGTISIHLNHVYPPPRWVTQTHIKPFPFPSPPRTPAA